MFTTAVWQVYLRIGNSASTASTCDIISGDLHGFTGTVEPPPESGDRRTGVQFTSDCHVGSFVNAVVTSQR